MFCNIKMAVFKMYVMLRQIFYKKFTYLKRSKSKI